MKKRNWPTVKFGDIANNVSERVDPAKAETDVYVGLEHLDPNTLHLREWGHPSDVTGQKLCFKKGDVIFGRRRAYQRKLAIAECDGICSAHAMVVRAKPKMILPEFLPFFLQSDMFMERAIDISVGSLSPTINWKTMKTQEFTLPPIDEQKRMAEILWAADEAKESYRKAMEDMQIQIRLHVTKRLNTFSGRPKSIKCCLSGSPESGCSAPPSPTETGHYVLSLAALSRSGYVPQNLKPVKKTKAMESALLKRGDLLISRSNTMELVGFAGIFDEDRADVSFPDTMMRLNIAETVCLPHYLEMVLLSQRGRLHMMRTAQGTSGSMKKINRQTLFEFKLPVPGIDEQRTLVDEVSAIKANAAAIANHTLTVAALMSRLSTFGLGGAIHV